MDIEKIFTKKNIEILKLLSSKKMHMREIANQLKCSPAKVHNAVNLMNEYGLVDIQNIKNKKIIGLKRGNKLAQDVLHVLEEKSEKPDSVEEKISLFDNINPMDYRYYGRNKGMIEKCQPYLSENGRIAYMARVEAALTNTLAEMNICSKSIAKEVEDASKEVTAQEVYEEEDRIKHDVRALANSIRKRVSAKAKPYVHFTTTSHDIVCSSDAARYKDFTNNALVPAMIEFEKTLISIAEREKRTLQIGRTHGQHAEPITFGFAVAQYVDRFGNCILDVKRAGNNLRGKIAGAVGNYAASSIFIKEPEKFEEKVLARLGIKPSPISTQVVEAEYMADYMHTVVKAFGVIANLGDDMRHLQRSEISEVAEAFGEKQVGSSTMPHKRNPINFENVKSLWKVYMPRMTTVYMDQISEHQRDLTNSASARFVSELLAGFLSSVIRLNKVMKNLVVDKNSLRKNFDMNKQMIAAEPAYILLAAYNHPDAHERVRELTLKAQQRGKQFQDVLFEDKSLRDYLKKFNKKQIEILKNPEKYTGICEKKTEKVCGFWREKLNL